MFQEAQALTQKSQESMNLGKEDRFAIGKPWLTKLKPSICRNIRMLAQRLTTLVA